MIEFDVDMSYLLEEGELDCVVLNDENGEHEALEFVPKLGSGECDTRWHELFGTPERAARTWIKFNGIYHCADCPICHDERGATCEIQGDCAWNDEEGSYDALLEWLLGKAAE